MSIEENQNHPFAPFNLSDGMLAAITRKGWTVPTSIQGIALPRLLADEGHLIVKARTGTGKTAAFGIPLIEKITQAGRLPRALILTPTRELALQVSKEIASLVSGQYPRITAVYGGASIRNQLLDLRRGTEIVVGTPGRVMDLMDRKALDLSAVGWFILDEADEMLDMGFFEDVEKIMGAIKPAASDGDSAEQSSDQERPARERLTRERLTGELRIALFSATMPEPILRVIRKHIGNAEILEDAAPEDEKPAVDQFFVIVKREDKLEVLRRLIDQAVNFYGLVFCATKAETDELARRLIEAGYPAEAIHGDLSQDVRERTLRRFRQRQQGSWQRKSVSPSEAGILVATDVAARGLDIEGLTHVINWDLPNDRETYVHRIGRTGRAGRRGIAISLALPAERGKISHMSKIIERSLGTGLVWLNVPSVKSVMKSVRRRIVSGIMAAAPGADAEADLPPIGDTEAAILPSVATDLSAGENAPNEAATEAMPADSAPPQNAAIAPAAPFLAKLFRELIERVGAEQALAALVTLNYGDLLDSSRYGPITEFSDDDFRTPVRGAPTRSPFRGRDDRGRHRDGPHTGSGKGGRLRHRGGKYRDGGANSQTSAEGVTRLYVGLGRRHGAGARDVAKLLMQAGGVPGRLVDEIEMSDYCSFATLPSDAAQRACAFTRNGQNDPVIRPASPSRH